MTNDQVLAGLAGLSVFGGCDVQRFTRWPFAQAMRKLQELQRSGYIVETAHSRALFVWSLKRQPNRLHSSPL
jgi:hypothetical protein